LPAPHGCTAEKTGKSRAGARMQPAKVGQLRIG